MALFRKKPAEEETTKAAEGGDEPFEPQPDKARTWFQHAQTQAETANFDYALHCFASGVRFDPELMDAHKRMYEVAIKYAAQGGKPSSSKERASVGDEKNPVSRFAVAEYAWMKDIRNPELAVKAIEAATKAELHEVGRWMAKLAVPVIKGQKKVKKSLLVKAMDLFAEVGAWDEAMFMGGLAQQADPTDGDLAQRVKDMAAQRAMDRGGYERAAGREGGFRDMVRDADRQQELEDADSVSASESVEERNLRRAKEAYEADPSSIDALNRFAQMLKRTGKPDDEEEAYNLYMEGYERTGEYRLRAAAGDIRIAQARRKERQAAERHEQNPADEQAKAAYQQAKEQRLELQSREMRERVQKYPTDRQMKYEMAAVEYELGNYDEAMAGFQSAKDEPKYRVRAGHMLGRCFAAECWYTEAVAEYREALDVIDPTERDRELAIRYDLMVALMNKARDDNEPELARDALEICSGIARKDITYRDIRTKRKEIDALVKELEEPTQA